LRPHRSLVAASKRQSFLADNAGTDALLFKDDPEFWFEIVRLFGAAEYGGALFGEVIAFAKKIKSGDYDSWCEANNAVADRLADEAEGQLKKAHKISARDNYLRASSYYRSAEFFLHANPRDPRMKRAFERTTACYRQAAALFTPAIETVEIPFEGTTLTGYFHPTDTSGAPRKTLILNNGFDGSPEEMHWNGARAAVDRGFNVLVFDSPGQFASVHRQGLHFRGDWENVVTPVVDYLLTRKDVDPKGIALHGESLGATSRRAPPLSSIALRHASPMMASTTMASRSSLAFLRTSARRLSQPCSRRVRRNSTRCSRTP
jgi:hypothetical protein